MMVRENKNKHGMIMIMTGGGRGWEGGGGRMEGWGVR